MSPPSEPPEPSLGALLREVITDAYTSPEAFVACFLAHDSALAERMTAGVMPALAGSSTAEQFTELIGRIVEKDEWPGSDEMRVNFLVDCGQCLREAPRQRPDLENALNDLARLLALPLAYTALESVRFTRYPEIEDP